MTIAHCHWNFKHYDHFMKGLLEGFIVFSDYIFVLLQVLISFHPYLFTCSFPFVPSALLNCFHFSSSLIYVLHSSCILNPHHTLILKGYEYIFFLNAKNCLIFEFAIFCTLTPRYEMHKGNIGVAHSRKHLKMNNLWMVVKLLQEHH